MDTKDFKTFLLTENIKNNLNREILLELVLTKVKKEFYHKAFPKDSKLISISKIITTDIISSFQVWLSF